MRKILYVISGDFDYKLTYLYTEIWYFDEVNNVSNAHTMRNKITEYT